MSNHHATNLSNQRGIAMITVLLVLILMSALLVGFTTVVISDQRYRFIDRDRGQAFYAATGAIEKMTADLGNLFLSNVAPTAAQVTNLTVPAMQPSIPRITFSSPNQPQALPASQLTNYYCAGNKTVNGIFMPPRTPTVTGTAGYTITFCALNSTGNPATSDSPTPIKWGPYEGLIALQTPYQLDVTAKTATGGEVHLSRTIEAVAIPVFQFGMFSDQDLSYYARDDFSFGGRVHTNGNLWLAEGTGNTLTLSAKITAVGQVVRQYLSNGVTIGAVAMAGTVSLPTQANAPTGNRILAATEGSVTGMAGAGQTLWAGWKPLSTGAAPPNYNGYIKNGLSGAKTLRLPLTAAGVGSNIDLIRRPVAGEDVNSILYNERLYTKASLRVLLSDTTADLTTLPGISLGAPTSLETNWKTAPPAGYVVSASNPPVALSPGNISVNSTASTATTITFAANANDVFKPILYASGLPTSANYFRCTGKAVPPATTLTGCAAVAGAALPASVAGQTIVTVSAAGGSGGASSVQNATTLVAGTITIPGATLANLLPLTIWDSAGTLITCTGWSTTQLLGCSSHGGGRRGDDEREIQRRHFGARRLPEDRAREYRRLYTDITSEILSYGIGANNIAGTFCGGAANWNPSPNAIVVLQRLRDNVGGCPYNVANGGALDPANWWPQSLYDTREGLFRDDDPLTSATGVYYGGVMYYVSINAQNLASWFARTGAYNTGTGNLAKTDNAGYTLYFSDRRNNRNAANQETAEYGWEDHVNPGNGPLGAPNGTCQAAEEDINGNGTCETYGMTPNYNGPTGPVGYNVAPPGNSAPLTTGGPTALPYTLLRPGIAKVNRPIIFRRALKLFNGATLAPTVTGLTIVSENPVYLQGDWNAAATFAVNDPHAATAIIADAVTILSNSWNDNTSYTFPYIGGQAQTPNNGRPRAVQSYYRVAILAGQSKAFTRPTDVAAASVFGTDGGAHNFLRMLEGSAAVNGTTVNYRGSMATLMYSRQATGVFKCCSGSLDDGVVYRVPVRNFIFDTDFLNPALLPPNSPVFRDMNAVGFSQELRPGR